MPGAARLRDLLKTFPTSRCQNIHTRDSTYDKVKHASRMTTSSTGPRWSSYRSASRRKICNRGKGWRGWQ